MVYALTDQKQEAIDDFIKMTKFNGDRTAFIQKALTQQCLMIMENIDTGKVMLADGEVVSFDVDKALAMPIAKGSPKYDGKKSVFVVGRSTWDTFANGCRIENYMRVKSKIGMDGIISIEEFFNNFVNAQAQTCLRSNRQAMLDSEFSQTQSEIQNNDKKKQ